MNTETLREVGESNRRFGCIVGHAPEMNKLYRLIAKAAPQHSPCVDSG